ncbi:MAG: HNH endonuclease [Baekduia sp.]
MSRVLVLNASYEPLHVCTVRRAVVLVLKAKAEIVERGGQALRSESASFDRPAVIRLVTYVRVPHDRHARRITRRAVFARDDWTCQYCGSKTTLTIDHVVPRSKGGTSGWENLVASCAPCNRRKGDKLPEVAGMHPVQRPSKPSPSLFLRLQTPVVPTAWHNWM